MLHFKRMQHTYVYRIFIYTSIYRYTCYIIPCICNRCCNRRCTVGTTKPCSRQPRIRCSTGSQNTLSFSLANCNICTRIYNGQRVCFYCSICSVLTSTAVCSQQSDIVISCRGKCHKVYIFSVGNSTIAKAPFPVDGSGICIEQCA